MWSSGPISAAAELSTRDSRPGPLTAAICMRDLEFVWHLEGIKSVSGPGERGGELAWTASHVQT